MEKKSNFLTRLAAAVREWWRDYLDYSRRFGEALWDIITGRARKDLTKEVENTLCGGSIEEPALLRKAFGFTQAKRWLRYTALTACASLVVASFPAMSAGTILAYNATAFAIHMQQEISTFRELKSYEEVLNKGTEILREDTKKNTDILKKALNNSRDKVSSLKAELEQSHKNNDKLLEANQEMIDILKAKAEGNLEVSEIENLEAENVDLKDQPAKAEGNLEVSEIENLEAENVDLKDQPAEDEGKPEVSDLEIKLTKENVDLKERLAKAEAYGNDVHRFLEANMDVAERFQAAHPERKIMHRKKEVLGKIEKSIKDHYGDNDQQSIISAIQATK